MRSAAGAAIQKSENDQYPPPAAAFLSFASDGIMHDPAAEVASDKIAVEIAVDIASVYKGDKKLSCYSHS